MLVFAGFFRGQVTGVPNPIMVKACGAELRDLAAAPGWEFDFKNLCAD
jgi:hypothetical protein